MSDLILSSVQMTSLEIAELVEKRHDNVKRTIETIAEKGIIVLPQIEDIPFVDESGRNRTTSAYVFKAEQGKRDSIVVVAQLSPEFTARLVDRWQALESGAATPAFNLEPQEQPFAAKVAKLRPREIREAFTCCMSIAKLCGLKDNAARLAADIGTRKLTGVSALALVEQTHLAANPRGQSYTATEIGKMLDPVLSAVKTNRLMEKRGLQVHDIKGGWVPTDAARNHCEWLDTNKRHSDGTPVKQLKWFASVVAVLANEEAA